ncbi:hypothetical protein [Rickettsia asembonensis]|uniref:hypothetical protein n=1 Tax=Rickettsia asembonensis TaxID=1068590 RepID=UPI00397E7EF3
MIKHKHCSFYVISFPRGMGSKNAFGVIPWLSQPCCMARFLCCHSVIYSRDPVKNTNNISIFSCFTGYRGQATV